LSEQSCRLPDLPVDVGQVTDDGRRAEADTCSGDAFLQVRCAERATLRDALPDFCAES
jgi:hypothetical protein